jgi:hypothetical protein
VLTDKRPSLLFFLGRKRSVEPRERHEPGLDSGKDFGIVREDENRLLRKEMRQIGLDRADLLAEACETVFVGARVKKVLFEEIRYASIEARA